MSSTSRVVQRVTRLLVTIFLGASATSAAAGPLFTGIDVPIDVGSASRAVAVSGNGHVVGGARSRAGDSDAFRWTLADGLTLLPELAPGDRSFATGVSGDGSVLVGSTTRSQSQLALRWSAGGVEDLGALDTNSPPSSIASWAGGVSGDGSTIVGSSTLIDEGPVPYENHAFAWTRAAGMRDLGIDSALGVSEDGSVIAGLGAPVDAPFTLQAMQWTADGAARALGGLGGVIPNTALSLAWGVSDDGATIVGWGVNRAGAVEAMRWTEGEGMVGLGDLAGGAFESHARAASRDGRVIVGQGTTGEGTRAFLWDAEHGMRDLASVLAGHGIDLSGWVLLAASGVSDDGRVIVGDGIAPNGRQAGWYAVIPEPGTAALLMLGLTGCALRRRI